MTMQIKENYMCLSKAAVSKTTSLKPVVAWMEFNEVCAENTKLKTFLVRFFSIVHFCFPLKFS